MRRTTAEGHAWLLRLIATAAIAGSWGPSLRAVSPEQDAPKPDATTARDEGEVPAALRPFDALIGAWKGFGIPEADRLRGWPEAHRWAWRFDQGRVAGLSVLMDGNKLLRAGNLGVDPGGRTYRLVGTDPEGAPVTYAGTLDRAGRTLTLDRVGPPGGPPARLVLRLNSNRIRYTLTAEARPRGVPRHLKIHETGLTREGEAFASKGATARLPECIITGGAATLSATHDGISYPLCCSGCLEEFQADPEKYIRRAALRSGGGASAPAPARPRRSEDGAFEGLVDDAPPTDRPAPDPGRRP